MRALFSIFFCFFVVTSVFAQAPNTMSYQTLIRNSSNGLVTNQTVGIKISVLQGSSGGTAVFVETHTPTTNANGLASMEIGGGTASTGTFAGIDWSKGPYFIKTETDPNGGTNYSIIGTSQLLSVPYALHAATANLAHNLIIPYRWEGMLEAPSAPLEIINNDTTHDATTAIQGIGGGKTNKFNIGVMGQALGKNGASSGVLGNGLYVGVRGVANYQLDKSLTSESFGVFGSSYSTFPGSSGVLGKGLIGVIAESEGDTSKKRTALELRNGYLKTTGDIRTAFLHTVTASNKPNGTHTSELNYPGMEEADILIVTRRESKGTASSYGVSWINDKWNIIHEDISKTLPVGDVFNVMVIKR